MELGVGNQSSSAEVVLDNKDDDVILEVSCSQAQSQLLVVLNEEAEAVVSSEDVDSLLAVKSSQNQALLVTKLELEEGVLETVSATHKKSFKIDCLIWPHINAKYTA